MHSIPAAIISLCHAGDVISSLTSDERLDLEQLLERKLQDILHRYVSYVRCISSLLEKSAVTCDSLRNFLFDMPPFVYDKSERSKLEECVHLSDVFAFLNFKYCSFLNCDILQQIIEKFEIVDLEYHYPEHLNTYIKCHVISELLLISPKLSELQDDHQNILVLLMDVELVCRLAKVTNLEKAVGNILNIKPSALVIYDISGAKRNISGKVNWFVY